MTAALLLGAAVAVLLWRPAVRWEARPPTRWRPPQLAGAAAGLGLGLLLGGLRGLVAGAAAAVLLPRLLQRLDRVQSSDAELAAALPLALDLLAACLAGGAAPGAAVSAVAAAFPGPCGDRLHAVAAALELGADPSSAWRVLGTGRDPAGSAARSLARAMAGGAPVAATVRRTAEGARRSQAAELRRRAARAGVWAVLPLGACFLPAFVLIGVVPAVVGLAGPILAGLG